MGSNEAKIFVGGLLREVDEDSLRQHFSKYGTVVRAFVVRDRITKYSRGHGFVWFSDPSSAKRALEKIDHLILGKAVQVKKPAVRCHQQQDPQHPPHEQVCWVGANGYDGNNGSHFRAKKIFVGGLPSNLTLDEFKKFFERFGETTDVVIMLDTLTRKPRGFGFVTFYSEESVEVVMQRNFYNLNGRYVEVKRAVPKNVTEYTDGGCSYANGHSRTTSESSKVQGSFFPYYNAYGAFPSYDYFQGFGKSGPLPYLMSSYWVPYHVHPFYAQTLASVNCYVQDSVVGVLNMNGYTIKAIHKQANDFNRNGNVAHSGEIKNGDNSPRILGDIRLDDDNSGGNGDRGASSC
ncbi:hypothetical protein SAY86_021608 [Trapa natans]|uniref:RRM domain-containing protein n=1 Tax=Trapa natans TaxID=22666 RepID=A0AAN7RKB3_TRANT|nr:hypothetical protein SAY86_021608 [Trapa natans]